MIKRIKIQEKRTMTREEFITLSKDHILYLDGATGSNLVKAGTVKAHGKNGAGNTDRYL